MIKAWLSRYPRWLWSVLAVVLLGLVLWVAWVSQHRDRDQALKPIAERLQGRGIEVQLPVVAAPPAEEIADEPEEVLGSPQAATADSIGALLDEEVTSAIPQPVGSHHGAPAVYLLKKQSSAEQEKEQPSDEESQVKVVEQKIAAEADLPVASHPSHKPSAKASTIPANVGGGASEKKAKNLTKVKGEGQGMNTSPTVAKKPSSRVSVAASTAKPVAETAQSSAKSSDMPSAHPAQKKSPTVKPAQVSQGPGYYTVQVASYHSKAAAEKVQKQLTANHFMSRMVHDGQTWRVEVGRSQNKALLSGLQQGIDRALKVRSWLRFVRDTGEGNR